MGCDGLAADLRAVEFDMWHLCGMRREMKGSEVHIYKN